MSFERITVVDWSAANVPRTGRDSIWIAAHGADGLATANPRTRAEAEAALHNSIESALAAGERLLIGADFAFGYPAGFAQALTGRPEALAVWEWIAARLDDDAHNRNDRFALAAAMNRALPGLGPYWFHPPGQGSPDLPLKGTARHGHGFNDLRVTDTRASGAQSVWKLGGPGSVGSQVLTGLPMLWRLRAAFPGQVAVWPFEPWQAAPVVLAEVYPSLLRDEITRIAPARPKSTRPGAHDWPVVDEVQVRLLALALARLGADGRLDALFAAPDSAAPLTEEGWILGVGAEQTLRAAARAVEANALPPRPVGSAGTILPRLTPPRLRDDCFAMPQGVDWVTVDDALARLRAALAPITDTESLPPARAGGRVLACDAIARRSNPPQPNAAVDGFGFAHAGLTGAGPHELPLLAGRAAAGQPFAGAVPPGTALRILTGAILPAGVDTVVLEEDCASDTSRVAFDGPVRQGANTRRAGEDVPAGATALNAGRRLTPADLALLTVLGIGRVQAFRRLRVAVLSTGDELLDDPATDAAPHQIFDANRPMLLDTLVRWGHAPVDLGHAPDDPAEIARRLEDGAARADVILTSGGASAGDEDHVSRLLAERAQLSSWRIAIKPGRPLALALWPGAAGARVPVFGLPGNPVAALVCTLIFARPALSFMAGAGWTLPLAFSVPAAFSKRKKPGRREYLRARLNDAGAAEVFASEGSGRISGLSWADGLVELPDDAVDIVPGAPVRYLPFAGFGLV